MRWPLINLEDIALKERGSIVSGPFGSNIGSRFFVEEGVPVIRGNNLTKGARQFIDKGFVFITEEKAREFPNCVALPGDIVFTAAGSIGQVGLIPGDCFYDRYIISNKQLRVRLEREAADPKFVYFWLSSKKMVRYLEGMNNGGAVPLLNLGIIRKVPVPLPDLPTQKRISSILRAYDDLIENNHRRIQLLEESARLLYREWFVHLRFPGHEHVKVIDGVPEGWESRSADELCHVFRGRSYRSTELVESGGQDFINLKCVNRSGGFRTEGIKRFSGEHKRTHVASPGSIIIAVTDMTRDRLVIGEAARVPSTVSDDAIISMDLVRIEPCPEVEEEWFYFMLRYSTFAAEVKEKASGTNVLHLNPRHIREQKVILPFQSLRREFSDAVRPILKQVDCLRAANEKLSHARDLLLPRLMNGEIAV